MKEICMGKGGLGTRLEALDFTAVEEILLKTCLPPVHC